MLGVLLGWSGVSAMMVSVMRRDVHGQTFAQRVKNRREELELTLRQAAKQANLGLDTWRTVERGYKARKGVDPKTGTHLPERITVRKIARVLEWPPDKALRWAGYDEPAHPPTEHVSRERQELTALIASMPDDQIALLVNLARAITEPHPGPGSTYHSEKIPAPPEVPNPRDTEPANGNS